MAIMTAIYGGGPFYEGGQPVMDDLRASGFTTVVEWGPQVAANGDLVLNPGPVISNGEYVGYPDWPAQLASLKEGPTSVTRLRFMPGGWGSSTFPNIKALIDSQGNGPDSILYRNYAALKQAIPTVDGIDFDDESLYDRATTLAFSQMLNGLGYEVTFCPYTEMQFWVDCLAALNSETPNLVTAFNLQCYSGGAGNDPRDWIDAIAQAMGPDFPAGSFIYPGLWCRNGGSCDQGSCPSDITSQFAGWKPSGTEGGFIWLYDDIQHCAGSGACGGGVAMDTAAYASAIVAGLQ
jgi:hypothetical protein